MSLGLSAEDLAREVTRFGVADEQVRRDHLISHVLGADAVASVGDRRSEQGVARVGGDTGTARENVAVKFCRAR